MSDSGILQQALKIEKVNRKKATHFALCNGDKIRYLITLNGGKKRLGKNISTYSGKLELLMRLLKWIPLPLLMIAKMGYFVKAELHPAIQKEMIKICSQTWNMIVGTYDEKQKLVFQCFCRSKVFASFLKIGNHTTENEMLAEMVFLESSHNYHTFKIPTLIGCRTKDEECPFNLQITEEFTGNKVEPELNEDIVEIYREISKHKKVVNGLEYEFSHGDFAPWNIKKSSSGYVVFDWEHCGYRIKGFDLMHYATITEIVMNGKSLTEACELGFSNILKFDPVFSIDMKAFIDEFQRLRRQIG